MLTCFLHNCIRCLAGKSRKLYLPGGLLSLEDDVPSYLDGTLDGE